LPGFKLQSWNAVAPGLETQASWISWLEHPVPIEAELPKKALKQVPTLLRRRFTEPGRCAASAVLPLVADIDKVPAVFASRHGDTHLTLSLLEGIAEQQPMSPTGFSLAVHNAVSGLLSIVRKDISEVTAIASVDCLIPHALLEASTRLQDHEQVLCVLYDVPLPELYQPFATSEPFPFALAMLLGKDEGIPTSLELHPRKTQQKASHELIDMMKFLCGLSDQAHFYSGAGSCWQLCRE